MQVSCTDSDGGQNYLTVGIVTRGVSGISYILEESRDSCGPGFPTGLTEYSCDGTDLRYTSIDCSANFGPGYICRGGACVQE